MRMASKRRPYSRGETASCIGRHVFLFAGFVFHRRVKYRKKTGRSGLGVFGNKRCSSHTRCAQKTDEEEDEEAESEVRHDQLSAPLLCRCTTWTCVSCLRDARQ